MQGSSEQTRMALLAKRFTIVLITHNRLSFLRRALEFYSAYPCSILVLDSSTLPAMEVAERFPEVDYRHLPDFKYQHLQEKLAYGVRQVKTPYMTFAADDDFVRHDAFSQCLAFLENNPDYGLCQGYNLMYLATGDEVAYFYRDRKGPEDYAAEAADHRLLDYSSHFLPPFYAVTRTDLLAQWYDAAPSLSFEYMEIGHAFFLLTCAKARTLPIPYGVRELNYPKSEHETFIHQKLIGTTEEEQCEREQFASFFVDLATGLLKLDRDNRIAAVLQAMEIAGNCLQSQSSLTVKEIFRSGWRELGKGPQRNFLAMQYIEMPFYNSEFFAFLDEVEYLIHALPCGRLQRQSLEPLLLKQQETIRVHADDTADEARQRLTDGMALYPFNPSLLRQFAQSLRQAGDSQSAIVHEQWAQRLEHIRQVAAPPVLENSLSGFLYERLYAWAPTPAQSEAIVATLQSHQGGPLLGLVLLDLEGDFEKLQVSLDSILENHYKRYRIVVLSTATPPVATLVGDRLHFLHIQAGSWQQSLNRLAAQADWDWLMLADVGVRFSPTGLLNVALELLDAGDCRALYGDELQLLSNGTLTSLYRPSFNLDLLLSSPKTMAGHWLIRRDVFLELGGYNELYPQAVEFELILRLIEQGGMSGIGHIDELLLTSNADSVEYNGDEINALRHHLNARGYANAAVIQTHPRLYHLHYGHAQRPLVSILIPTKDQVGMVQRCVESVLECTRYNNFEIILIDNQSETEEALRWLAGIESMNSEKLRVLRYAHPFNFSAINNFAAAQARGEYLILLNNDTAVIKSDWLDELLNHAMRPEVGIVGARLLYPDGTLQHAGVVLGLRGPAEHPWLNVDPEAPSYMNRTQVDQNFSAVTAACLMIRKSIYEAVEGLDEQQFKVSYNDVDLCLKVGAAGYLTVWTPHATLMHEGSVSQRSVDPLSQMAKHKRFADEQNAMYGRWMKLLANDPAYNRNLSLSERGFEIDNKPLLGVVRRDTPVVLVLADPSQRSKLTDAYQGLTERANVVVVHQRLSVPELIRFAPDVLIVPASLCWADLLSLGYFRAYSSTLKVLDLSAFAALDWQDLSQVPNVLCQGLKLVDRVLVPSAEIAQALAGLHNDIRMVPALLEVSGKPASLSELTFQAIQDGLDACLS